MDIELIGALARIQFTLEQILKELQAGREMAQKISTENAMEGRKMEGELKGIIESVATQFHNAGNKGRISHG